jgi:hypothetical protein
MPYSPADEGLPYYECSIWSTDGITELSTWIIDNPGSTKTAIVSHPLRCSKYGFVPLEKDRFVAVNFIKLYKVLFDAGYSIIAYDFRG